MISCGFVACLGKATARVSSSGRLTSETAFTVNVDMRPEEALRVLLDADPPDENPKDEGDAADADDKNE